MIDDSHNKPIEIIKTVAETSLRAKISDPGKPLVEPAKSSNPLLAMALCSDAMALIAHAETYRLGAQSNEISPADLFDGEPLPDDPPMEAICFDAIITEQKSLEAEEDP